MSRISTRHSLAILFVLMTVGSLFAQPKDNSPLSRFGLGDILDPNFETSASMGGLGATFHHLYQGNIVNPASLGHLEATALELGFFAKSNALEYAGTKATIWSGNIDYFSLSIPLINPINELLERREHARDFSWGLNISMLPYSKVGYLVFAEEELDSIGTVQRNFQGAGGPFRLNLGNGWRYGNFSVGVNLGLLFGQSEYLTETVFVDLFNNYEHVETNNTGYKGFLWNAGAMYEFQLGQSSRQNRKTLTLGLHFNSSTTFHTETDYLNYVRNPFFNDRDTAEYREETKQEGTLPGEVGFGIMYEEATKLRVGVDLRRTAWSDYMNESRPEELDDGWRFAAGAAYTPNVTSISSFLERVEYRAGFFYQNDPRSLDGEQVNHYGISAGMGLPFVLQRYFSFVNIGLEYGRRGTSDSLKENYLRVKLGFTLNDNQWFIKRRYN